MKPKDVLLERWEKVLAEKGDAPAIFDTNGLVARRFREIEEQAIPHANSRTTKRRIVYPIQIGNHFDWPSLFLASLRTEQVVLPIDESVSLSRQKAHAVVSIAAQR